MSAIDLFCEPHQRRFTNLSEYRQHSIICKSLFWHPITCEIFRENKICAKRFRHLSELIIHCKEQHQVYLCDLCEGQYKSHTDLENHTHLTTTHLNVYKSE